MGSFYKNSISVDNPKKQLIIIFFWVNSNKKLSFKILIFVSQKKCSIHNLFLKTKSIEIKDTLNYTNEYKFVSITPHWTKQKGTGNHVISY
jgi:hypothetical protein